MWIIRVALNRPYTFIVLALLILLLSPVIILTAPTDMFPNIDIPVVAVGWVYTGLSPQELSSDVLITPAAQKEIDDITGRIDNTEAEALAQLKAKRLDRSEQITLLGKL